jgi:16S rRNA (adenine1518-N6/adenine1519-N6)-dimethyltransferase
MSNGFEPLNTRALLYRFGLHPNKRLGQNFLVDEHFLKSIVELAAIQPHDTILEIGPGLGHLTRHLAQVAGKVVAVELDQALFPALQSILKPFSNVQLVHADILELSLMDLVPQEGFIVVANIPYNITSALLRHLLEGSPKPGRIVLTVQKEIAERICAERKLSLLAVSVQVYGRASIQMHIPAQAFYPVPKVDSAVVQIAVNQSSSIDPNHLNDFFRIVRAGFSQKRKTLRNALAGGLHLSTLQTEILLARAGIESQRRAETLSLAEWEKLMNAYTDPRSL